MSFYVILHLLANSTVIFTKHFNYLISYQLAAIRYFYQSLSILLCVSYLDNCFRKKKING